ncbi:MAG: hypothetical protein R3F56_10560 [Planctomycetota bacterium]
MPPASSCAPRVRVALLLSSFAVGALPAQNTQDPAEAPTDAARRQSLERARAALAARDGRPQADAERPGGAAQGRDTSTGLRLPPTSTATGLNAGGAFRLIDISLDVIGSVGTSTARDEVIQQLQGGNHDPKQRGFTLQQAELAIAGAVDPYFRLDAHLTSLLDPDGETIVELEEAYATSTSLPLGLQLKAGHFLTEFGRINPVHLHEWDWGDQPLIVSRLFGGDGLRAPGARLSWVLPTDTLTEVIVGVQNARGETTKSFLANEEAYDEAGVGGRRFVARDTKSLRDMLYTARIANSSTLGDSCVLGLGGSALYGANATGSAAETLILGLDFVFLWRPVRTDKGWPFFKVQGEWLTRTFDADQQVDENDPDDPGDDVVVPGDTLRDHGGFLQALYGFRRGWSVGVRGEYATGSGASYDADTDTFSRQADFDRTDRLRLSPMLVYQPSEFSRLRLQYDFDDSDHLRDAEHSVWLTFQTLIGVHQPHRM